MCSVRATDWLRLGANCISAACLTAPTAVVSVSKHYVALPRCICRCCLPRWMRGCSRAGNERCAPGHCGCPRGGRDHRFVTGFLRCRGSNRPCGKPSAGRGVHARTLGGNGGQKSRGSSACQRQLRRPTRTGARSHAPLTKRFELDPVTRRFSVLGKVQGVYFRDSSRVEAARLAICGYARNLADGSVEVLAHGAAASVEELRVWLTCGPPQAKVHEVREMPPGDAPSLSAGFSVL